MDIRTALDNSCNSWLISSLCGMNILRLWTFFKRILSWRLSSLKMNPEDLSRICYTRLVEVMDNPSIPFNWAECVRTSLIRIGAINDVWAYQDTIEVVSNFSSLITKYEKHLISIDVQAAIISCHNIHYRHINSFGQREQYLNINTSISKRGIKAQLRLANSNTFHTS